MAAADGIPELVTPYNTEDFERMVTDVMARFNGVKGQAEVVAADLRRLLPRATNAAGRMGLFGLDLQLAAHQVSRQWSQVAGACNSASAAASRSLAIYHGTFGAPSGSHGRTFTVT